MLFGIIGTIDRGNFVFDRWPRSKEFLKVGLITAGELSEKLAQHFQYFGFFRKNKVFETAAASFSEACFIQIFNANQKRLEVVLGIDDECVMVSRSVFITNNSNSFCQNPGSSINANLFVFQDLEQQKKDIVNSVTLAWRAQNFHQVSNLKNKLSFMVGLLRRMQQSEGYLSKQIVKITETKDSFEKKLKQKCLQLNKDPSLQLEEFKAKEIFQQFYDLAEDYIKEIDIFKQMSKFFACCVSDTDYAGVVNSWAGAVSSNFKVPIRKDSAKEKRVYQVISQEGEDQTLQNFPCQSDFRQLEQTIFKTTLATQKKLILLPEALRDERISRLYDTVLKMNDASLEQITSKEKWLNLQGTIQTIQFIKINGIGINVYPFDLKKYYNLYALKKMPSWASIKKFDTRIFPKESILKQIHPFGKFKRINNLNEKLKYIILQSLIKEISVYIYYLESLSLEEHFTQEVRHFCMDPQDQWEEESQSRRNANNHGESLHTAKEKEEVKKQNLLGNFVNKPHNLNQILRQEPMFGKMSEILKLVIERMEKKNPRLKQDDNGMSEEEKAYRKPKWGFYYIQNS